MTTQELMTTVEDIFVTKRIVAFESYNFIYRKQKKSESLEQFHADTWSLQLVKQSKLTRSQGGFRGRPYPRGTQNTTGQQRNNNLNISNNVTSAESNTIKIIFNLARLKTRFDQNVPHEVILQKFVDPQTLTT